MPAGVAGAPPGGRFPVGAHSSRSGTRRTRMTVVGVCPGSSAGLGHPDAPAAKRFTGLFGWTAEDMPTGEDELRCSNWVASRLRHSISRIAAAGHGDSAQLALLHLGRAPTGRRADEESGQGGPDGTVRRAGRGPDDDDRDPTGAVVALWEPRRRIGAEVIGSPTPSPGTSWPRPSGLPEFMPASLAGRWSATVRTDRLRSSSRASRKGDE
jgi:hypothetical protein